MNVHYARIRKGMGAALLAVIVGTGSAWAQNPEETPFNISARAGVAIPAGELWQMLDPGVHAGAALSYYFDKHVGVRAEFAADFLNDREDSTGGTPSPGMTLLHFNGGVEFNFARPSGQSLPLTFVAGIGAGATSATASESYADDSSVDFSSTVFTANASAEVGWQFNPNVNVFLGFYAYLMKFSEEDTQVFADRSPDVEAFGWAYSFPITLGVKFTPS